MVKLQLIFVFLWKGLLSPHTALFIWFNVWPCMLVLYGYTAFKVCEGGSFSLAYMAQKQARSTNHVGHIHWMLDVEWKWLWNFLFYFFALISFY